MAKKLRTDVRNAANWSVGFVLTGHVFHGLDWKDYREAGPRTVLSSLVALGFSCLCVIYVTLVMPWDIQFLLLSIWAIIFGFIAVIFISHWVGVKWIERNQ